VESRLGIIDSMFAMFLEKLKRLIFGDQCRAQSTRISHWNTRFLLIVLLLFLPVKNVSGKGSNNNDSLNHELQVAMIFKILDFIQWRPESFKTSDKIFRIGVIGKSPILNKIKALEEERIKGLQVKVKLVENVNNAKNFHLLYICPKEIRRMPSVLMATEGAKTLTMSKAANFAKKGGMVNFYEKKGKMRFEINLEMAQKSGFKISSRVLALSKIVSSESQ
jgi:hypothetical protein